jgi:hypothetical protein
MMPKAKQRARVVPHLHLVCVELDAAVLVELKRLEIGAVCAVCLRAHAHTDAVVTTYETRADLSIYPRDKRMTRTRHHLSFARGMDAWRRGLIRLRVCVCPCTFACWEVGRHMALRTDSSVSGREKGGGWLRFDPEGWSWVTIDNGRGQGLKRHSPD